MTSANPNDPCVFCEILAMRAPAEYIASWHDAIAIVPLGPVTEGHILIIPRYHVADAAEEPALTGEMFRHAAVLADGFGYEDFNLITSKGREATQTVDHLHVHLVPRRKDDGLPLPWTKVPAVEIVQKDGEPATAKVWRDGALIFDGVDRSAVLLAKAHVHEWMAPQYVGEPEQECACGAALVDGVVVERYVDPSRQQDRARQIGT